MKQIHTRRDKGRALFLAALMVLSVFAMSVSFAGAAAAQEPGEPGALYWQGQEVTFNETDFNTTSDSYQLRAVDSNGNPGSLQGEITAETDGTITVDTSNLDGEYGIALDSNTWAEINTENVTFEVAEQTLDASFEDESINADGSTNLTVDSNRANYDVEVTSNDFSGDELGEMFNESANAAVTVEGDSLVVQNAEGSHNVDFTGVNAGEYDFTVSVADTDAEDTATISVAEEIDANASFDQSVYSEEIGDEAEMTVEMEGTDTVTVNMTDDSEEYNLNFDVTDVDGDGEVTVHFNTYLAGQNDANVVSAEGEDTVTVNAESDLGEFNLQPSDLDLELYVDGNETDVATLGLNERSTGDAWTGVAPNGADLSDVESINNATTDGSEVAEGDSLIVKVDVSGIFGFLGDDAESNIGAIDEDITFNLEQTNPDRYQNAHEFDLNSDGVSVVSDSDNNALYFVIDTSANANIEAGQEYDATFSVNDSYAYADGDESSETSFSVVERTNELTGEFDEEDRLQVGNDAEATISGESTAAPGTDVQVRLRATGEDPFLMSQTVQVQEDGTFEATFDLSDNQVGQEFSISVTDMEEDANGIIVESGPAPHSVVIHVEDADGNAVSGAEITVGDQSATTDDDGKATLELAHGEYKVNASYDGVEANGKLTVDDQTPDEITLTLGEEDVDYNEKANEDEQKDEEQKDEKQNDEKQSDEKQNDENNDDEQPGSGADEQPGFGIAVALVALLAAAGIALRRQ